MNSKLDSKVRRNARLLFGICLLLSGVIVLNGCGKGQDTGGDNTTPGATKTGTGSGKTGGDAGKIAIDGSTTVQPISSAVAEEFEKTHNGTKVTVNGSGTGAGFKKFANQENDISDASRPIQKEEEDALAPKKIQYIELPVAFDGICVVVNPKNNWANDLTTAELKKIWEPGSTVNNWKDVRAGFPDKPLKLYGTGQDSGTFDYFTEAINGKAKAVRQDYSANSDQNGNVQGIAGDEGSLGFISYAYYEQNKDKLKLLGVDAGSGVRQASRETIQNGNYAPLSRPLFIYVRLDSLNRPEVQEFVKYYLTEGRKLVESVGYVPLPDKAYEMALERLNTKKTGSMFTGATQVGVSIEQLMAKESQSK